MANWRQSRVRVPLESWYQSVTAPFSNVLSTISLLKGKRRLSIMQATRERKRNNLRDVKVVNSAHPDHEPLIAPGATNSMKRQTISGFQVWSQINSNNLWAQRDPKLSSGDHFRTLRLLLATGSGRLGIESSWE